MYDEVYTNESRQLRFLHPFFSLNTIFDLISTPKREKNILIFFLLNLINHHLAYEIRNYRLISKLSQFQEFECVFGCNKNTYFAIPSEF